MSYGAHIREVVLLLVSLEFALYTAKFLFNEDQTLVDEVGCVARRTVLVEDPFFVVSVDECTKDSISTARIGVLERKHDYR